MGGAPSVPVTKPPDAGQEFTSALNAYTGGAPQLYSEEAQYQPMYNQLQQGMGISNIQAYLGQAPGAQYTADYTNSMAQGSALSNLQQYGGAASQAALNANPYTAQMQGFSQNQLNAGLDPTLQGILGQVQGAIPGQVGGFNQLGQQLGQGMNPINAAVGGLAQQAGYDPSNAQGFMTGLRNQVAANTRTPGFQQLSSNVMGQLGNLSPLGQQIQTMGEQQLALGSSLSPAEIADATQAARAAYSSRGLAQSNPAMVAEVLNRYDVGQQRLQQREQFGMGAQQLVQGETQQNIANAMGVQQTDIGLTQANQQMAGQFASAIPALQQAQITQQAGLYGQLAGNVMGVNQQQMGLQQAANAAQMGGYQQAAGLQQALLGQQQGQQTLGMQGLQYLSGLAGQGMQGVLGTQGSAFGPLIGGGLQAGTGGPSLFNSSGMLPLEAQNQMAGYNQMNQANMVNAQSKGASSGAMIGAGAGIVSAIAVGAVAL